MTHFYRRDLPHWRIEGACYFVTFRVHEKQSDLWSEERTLVQETLLHGDGTTHHLDAHVVMNDHVSRSRSPKTSSALWSIFFTDGNPFPHGGYQRLGPPSAPIWQREYFDRVVRDDAEWLEKMAYIVHNPIKRWPGGGDYPWVYPQP